MRLAVVENGASSSPPLVILHGLLGSSRNWGSVAKALSDSWHVLAFDLPNHGASPWAETMDYPFMAREIAAAIETLGRKVVLLGHSMGGKAAMTLALTRPDLVERLVVVDIAPVAYDHTFAPFIRAMRAVRLSEMRSRADVSAALTVAVPDPAFRAFLLQNLESGAEGYRWRPNLAVLLAHMDDILGFPASPPGRNYSGPTLFIAGGRSEYLRPIHRDVIAALFPAARHTVIADAGHWIHADAQTAFITSLVDFLRR
ncbi:alpha/beta fold hydrolase [Magnetospirillum molischianum]|uniref:Abhydrolase domain-containing protein 11 n=1 Tax=Magnetospirillum molischianum DSM 120 TaxID=1150626 RepID=H8FXL2_MAGML|nr:alpha/beta fold hydrolase [Magnetospirillum molischianum]CCG43100.1 Abhydrolase domain-containing protein 11 [Magnetospirillum molischianum DSM 120]